MIEDKATFFARIEPRLAPSDFVRVRGAYYLAKYGHRGQVRQEPGPDGNPLRYFEHVRRVTLVLLDEAKCFDPDLICAALLHDTIEDCEDIDAHVIEQFFGTRVARVVKLLSKVPVEGYLDRLSTAEPGVLLVKACDRLDNLRSLGPTPPEFQERQKKETREKYLPMFNQRVGESGPYREGLFVILTKIEPLLGTNVGRVWLDDP